MGAEVTLPDYRVWGNGPYTIFLLHGGYGSAEYWIHEADYLRRAGYRVVAWDTPGYGTSPIPEGEYSIESLAEQFVGLLTAVGGPGKTNIILGHSMGGLIAPKVATMVPERVAALVISATVESLGHTEPEFQSEFLAERLAPLDAGLRLKDAAPTLIAKMMGPASSGESVELVKRVTADTPDSTFRKAIEAIVKYDGRSVIREINVPTLCIAGEHDPVGRPDMMAALSDSISGAEFCLVEGAAHYAWAEYPEIFNAELMAFLTRVIAR